MSSAERMRRHRARVNAPVDVLDDQSPAHVVHTWAWAPAYRAASYVATPVWFHDIEAGRESSPTVQVVPSDAHYVPPRRVDQTGIAIACSLELRTAVVPTVHGTEQHLSWAPVACISALRLNIAQDHALAGVILDTLIKPRLTWARDVTTRLMPVRSTLGSAALLIPLRLDTDAHYVDSSTARYALPADVHPANKYLPGPVNSASLKSWREIFVASGPQYRWTDGGLPAVARASLPMIADARGLVQQIDQLLEARGTRLNYTITNVC